MSYQYPRIPFRRRFRIHLDSDIWWVSFGFVLFAVYFRSSAPNRYLIYESGITIGWIPWSARAGDTFPSWDWKVQEYAEESDRELCNLREWRPNLR